jgi:hypothetical protein
MVSNTKRKYDESGIPKSSESTLQDFPYCFESRLHDPLLEMRLIARLFNQLTLFLSL